MKHTFEYSKGKSDPECDQDVIVPVYPESVEAALRQRISHADEFSAHTGKVSFSGMEVDGCEDEFVDAVIDLQDSIRDINVINTICRSIVSLNRLNPVQEKQAEEFIRRSRNYRQAVIISKDREKGPEIIYFHDEPLMLGSEHHRCLISFCDKAIYLDMGEGISIKASEEFRKQVRNCIEANGYDWCRTENDHLA